MGYIIFFIAWFACFALFGFGGGIFSFFVLLIVAAFIKDQKGETVADFVMRYGED